MRAAAARFDLTVLIARDPWHAGLPLQGFVRLRDAENGRVVTVYLDERGRERFVAAVAERERAIESLIRRMGARVGFLDVETGAQAALARTFNLG